MELMGIQYINGILVLVCNLLKGVASKVQCSEYSYTSGVKFFYCEEGCCGYTYDRICCEDEDDDIPIGAVIGISVAILVLIVGFSVIIICSCKKVISPGVVIKPSTQQHRPAGGTWLNQQNYGQAFGFQQTTFAGQQQQQQQQQQQEAFSYSSQPPQYPARQPIY